MIVITEGTLPLFQRLHGSDGMVFSFLRLSGGSL